jgi:hypothetical protein
MSVSVPRRSKPLHDSITYQMELRQRKPFLEVVANNWIRSEKYGWTFRS